MSEKHKSGYVAILGKPNAGKSTLMNALLGQKLSIVTHKAQTTRHQIKGFLSDENSQIIFLDTPGIIRPRYQLQKAMMQFVHRAQMDADLLLLIVGMDDRHLPEEVHRIIDEIDTPALLVLNKSDLTDQQQIGETAAKLKESLPISEHIFVSAKNGSGLSELVTAIKKHLPEGPPFYPKDQLSEHPVRFFVSEIIREEVFLLFHQEIPYSTTVEIIEYDAREDIDHIFAEIIVNAESQKGIIIGKGGKAIKRLGSRARQKIQRFIEKKVYLDLHVKVRPKWRDDDNMVRSLGY